MHFITLLEVLPVDFTKMTTSQMIEFLQAYEFGGASGKPRDITFWVNGNPYNLVALQSTGDGLVTEISIRLENSDRLKRRESRKAARRREPFHG